MKYLNTVVEPDQKYAVMEWLRNYGIKRPEPSGYYDKIYIAVPVPDGMDVNKLIEDYNDFVDTL